jgi:hypothetical protein
LAEVNGKNKLSVSRSLLITTAILVLSLIGSIAAYRGYRYIFPFTGMPSGVCRYCGEKTLLGEGGWKAFCPRHTPLMGIVQSLIIFGEAVFLLLAAASFWWLLRLFSRWRGKRASTAILIVCIACVVVFVIMSGGKINLRLQFLVALFISLLGLSAIYMESLESLFTVAIMALILAALVALLLRIISWVLIGYMQLA